MNRLKYIYWITPLFILLSCGRMLTGVLGTGWLMALVLLPFILLTWGIVWMRLYGMNKLRPEFAILSILPQSVYFVAKGTGTTILHQAEWQNLYAMSWIAFAVIIILSLRPGDKSDTKTTLSKDHIFIMMSILTVVYAFTTMGAYAAEICYP